MEPDQHEQTVAELKQDATDARQIATDERQSISNEALQEMVGRLAETVDKIAVNVDRVISDTEKTRQAMDRNSVALVRSRRENTMLRSALYLSLAAILVIGGLGWRLQVQSRCQTHTFSDLITRTAVLGPLSNARFNDAAAIVGLVLTNALEGKQTPVETLQRLNNQLGIDSSAYNAAYAATPVPANPKYACALF